MGYQTNETGHADPMRELRPFLHEGEEILWIGRPYATVSYRPPLFLMIFSVFWLGFSVVWTAGATLAGGPFGLFGIPFLVVGCGMVYFVWFGQRKRFRQTVYAVTDRRAIILTAKRQGIECTEFVLTNLSSIGLESVRGEAGTIRFVPEVRYDTSPYGRSVRRTYTPGTDTAFLMIDGVQSVYRLISERLGKRA